MQKSGADKKPHVHAGGGKSRHQNGDGGGVEEVDGEPWEPDPTSGEEDSSVIILLATATTFSYISLERGNHILSVNDRCGHDFPDCFSTKREFGDCEQLWAVTAES